MQDKVAQVRRLITEGYELEDIHSDGQYVEATLYRGGHRVVMRFSRSDAARLLHAPLRVRQLIRR